MASVTLTTLRARVRELADMTGSSFVTDDATSLDAFINAAADELYDLLTLKFQDYNLSSSVLTTIVGAGTYALPADFYKLMGVDLNSAGRDYALDEFTFRERNRYQPGDMLTPGLSFSPLNMQYRLEGTNLRLRPTPTAVYTGTIWYIPTRVPLVSGTDVLVGVSGWEEYAVVSAAIRCLQKEESDTAALMVMKAELKERIEQAAAVRSPSAPSKVVDVDGLNLRW